MASFSDTVVGERIAGLNYDREVKRLEQVILGYVRDNPLSTCIHFDTRLGEDDIQHLVEGPWKGVISKCLFVYDNLFRATFCDTMNVKFLTNVLEYSRQYLRILSKRIGFTPGYNPGKLRFNLRMINKKPPDARIYTRCAMLIADSVSRPGSESDYTALCNQILQYYERAKSLGVDPLVVLKQECNESLQRLSNH